MDLREFTLDGEARAQLTAFGLRHAAELARTLAGATPGCLPLGDVEEGRTGGRIWYAFDQLAVTTGDTSRVLVLEAGGRVFALTALAVPGSGEEVRREVAAAQEAFAGGLADRP